MGSRDADDPLGAFAHRFESGDGARVLLLLHGTGGNENDLIPLGRLLDPRAALLSPRGPVLEHGMPRFFRRLAEGVFDLEDLRRRAHQLADFIAAAGEKYGFDPQKIVAVGFSNGANIAAAVLLLRPGALAGAALFSPVVPLEPEPLPRLSGTPVWIGTGRADRIAPPEQAERLAALLRRAGAEVTIHRGEGGHVIAHDEVAAARTWLAHLRDEAGTGQPGPR